MAVSRGLLRTHHFAQARSVFAVAAGATLALDLAGLGSFGPLYAVQIRTRVTLSATLSREGPLQYLYCLALPPRANQAQSTR